MTWKVYPEAMLEVVNKAWNIGAAEHFSFQ
jgi:hypothetical protein